jgi:hypothetical protein
LFFATNCVPSNSKQCFTEATTISRQGLPVPGVTLDLHKSLSSEYYLT